MKPASKPDFMELSFLPKTVQTNSTFNRYSIKPKWVAENPSYTKSGFYYIGKNPGNIENLVKAFKRGYASDFIENAKSELRHCLIQEKNCIPEIIFCESQFDYAAIRSFRDFLNSHPALSTIPFVLEATHLGEKELSLYKKAKLTDEIINLEGIDEKTLLIKTKFLKKVKTRAFDLETISQAEKISLPSINFAAFLKRLFDIILSFCALFILTPFFVLIGLAICLESKGPVFYISKRAGRGYRIFDFFKFRTMYCGADKNMDEFTHLNQYCVDTASGEGPLFFKITNDPRVTRVGAFLRNTSMDELPQLINVLIGDMSLVGNRPLPLYEAATLTTDDWAGRFMAPAGMTGLWQIKKRGQKDMSAEERISLDLDYANRNNFMYDLWIMANTPSALIQKSNS
jgi:lipopolysaccharide/colanic/teichoic acid biosynthesis glycosyltransferase